MKQGSVLPGAFTGPGGVARLAGATVLLATVAAQHPSRTLDRVQRLDRLGGVLPNWRFFAPSPATHDTHFLYRTLNEEGVTSAWRAVEVISERRPHQIVWFPERRSEKAVFDLSTDLLQSLDKGTDFIVSMPSYRTICAFLRERITHDGADGVRGFQFTLAKGSGHDESEKPEVLFVSPYTPLDKQEGFA